MADKSNEQLQRELLETQLDTARIGRERAQQENDTYHQQQAARGTQNKQRQAILAQEAARREEIQRLCLHQQGGGPEDRYEGDGKSALTLSRVFFSNNFLIQCPRCDLALQRPHPKRKSPKAIFPGETAAAIKARVELYNADVTRYEDLLKRARSNKLRPMLGPTWEFQNEDGTTFIPDAK
jgi:multidrug efflux pump subunit AcrA (membrane-fusion protein)